MAKGVSTPPERKLAALAELEAGACTPEQVAEKYCVTTITLRTWQRTFEEGGSLEDAPSGQRARKLAQQQRLDMGEDDDTEPDEDEDEEPEDEGEHVDMASYRDALARLPSPPPPPAEGSRRSFSDDYKYTIARAVLDKHVSFTAMCAAHTLLPSNLSRWMQLVQAGELKGRRIRREPRDTDRQITVWREAPKPHPAPVEVVLPEPTRAPEPVQNDMPTVPQLLAEIDRLKNENARLKTKLRQALAMVIDED